MNSPSNYSVTVAKGERDETKKQSDNLKLEGHFQGKRKKDIVVASGERSTVNKHKDNLKLEGEFIRKVPEKWEPGQRAAVIKQRDNLVPPGPVEGGRHKEPALRGDRASPATYWACSRLWKSPFSLRLSVR